MLNESWNRNSYYRRYVGTKEEQQHLLDIVDCLSKLSEFKLRSEGTLHVSVYLMSEADTDKLVELVKDDVYYVSKPKAGVTLELGQVALPNIDYRYRINVKLKKENYDSFVNWTNDMGDRVRVTWSCQQKLQGKGHSWQNPVSYLYVKDSKELLIAQMHLGPVIKSVEENVLYGTKQAKKQSK